MDLNSMDRLTKIILSIAGIFGVVLAGVWKWLPRFLRLIFGTKTITLVNDARAPHENFWHIGSHGGQPGLQISCRFMVTNITDHAVALAKPIWKGKIKGTELTAIVLVKELNSESWGSFDIPPHARTRVSIQFFIFPIEMPGEGEVIFLSIGVVDQFGTKHWVKNVRLQST